MAKKHLPSLTKIVKRGRRFGMNLSLCVYEGVCYFKGSRSSMTIKRGSGRLEKRGRQRAQKQGDADHYPSREFLEFSDLLL